MIIRVLASILLLFSVLFMPFWASVILALAGALYFNIFWEAGLLFFLSDILFGVNKADGSSFVFTSFFISVIVLIAIEILKKKTKFYK